MSFQIHAPDYPISAVTVYSSSQAEVIRVFPVQLQPGQNKIEIRSLPGTLDTQSIRISGLQDAHLHDVICLLNPRHRPSPKDSSEILKGLRAKRAQIMKRREHLTEEAQILLNYSRTLSDQHISPHDIKGFLSMFREHGRENIEAHRLIDEELTQIDDEIWHEEDRAAHQKGPAPNGEVILVVASDHALAISLKLNYVVSQASWKPTYEFYATTSNGKPSPMAKLSYRAHVQQSTGEDWSGAQLTLSTSNTLMNTTIPTLPLMKIYPEAAPSGRGYTKTGPRMRWPTTSFHQKQRHDIAGEAVSSLHGEDSNVIATRKVPRVHPMTHADSYTGMRRLDDNLQIAHSLDHLIFPVLMNSALSASYMVQGVSTIPGNGMVHAVSISELEFETRTKYVAVPVKEPVVYLQCIVKNTSKYRLLPGTVRVILDGSFVSQASILDVPMGDTFTCTLGVDPVTQITYNRRTSHPDNQNIGPFAEARNTTSYAITITVTNKHSFDIEDFVIQEVLHTVADCYQVVGSLKDDGEEKRVNFRSRVRVLLKRPLGLAEADVGDVVNPEGKLIRDTADVDEHRLSAADIRMKVRWIQGEAEKKEAGEGNFEWFGRLGRGEKIELEAGWDIKAPEDVKWSEVCM